jgi:hypothetical protein
MSQPVEYTFNASALGLGGRYVRFGRQVVVPSVASVALAPTGGQGSAQVYNYNNDEGVEVASASSFVKGYEYDGVFTTESEIDIIGLSLFGRVFIEHMSAKVMSTRDTNVDGIDEATFQVSAAYEGVVVDDCGVDALVDEETCKADYATHHGAVAGAAAMNGTVLIPSLERGDPIRRSVVADLTVNGTAVTRGGAYILNVPGIGRMHFGELLVKRGRRRVNLLRFELGAPAPSYTEELAERTAAAIPLESLQRSAFTADSGTLSIGSGDGNGEPVWPRH